VGDRMKGLIYGILLMILLTAPLIWKYGLSQETIGTTPIKPVTDDKLTVCFSYTLEDSKTKKASYETMCRKYPTDLSNHCSYGRYGQVIRCEDILIKEINMDVKKWYKNSLPREVTKNMNLKDVIVTEAEGQASSLVGKEYDFMGNEFK